MERQNKNLQFIENSFVGALPCPFCGSEIEIETTNFGDSMTDYFRVKCKQKGHTLDWWEEDKNKAILVWNERQ